MVGGGGRGSGAWRAQDLRPRRAGRRIQAPAGGAQANDPAPFLQEFFREGLRENR